MKVADRPTHWVLPKTLFFVKDPMPKFSPNEPWLHTASGFWCKKVAGKLRYLDRDYKAAKRKLAKILRDRVRAEAGAHDWLSASFADLCDEFLENRGLNASTYRDYRYRLLRALKTLGPDIRVIAVNEDSLDKIKNGLGKKGLSPTTIRDTLATVQGVFRWALSREMISHDPTVGYKKPKARWRNRVVTPNEFHALLRASAIHRPFQRMLIALRRTGCRPGKLRNLTWDMVDLERGAWIIPEHKTVDTQADPRPRTIALPDSIWKMCRWLKGQPDRHEATQSEDAK